jgi:hypothetical protein
LKRSIKPDAKVHKNPYFIPPFMKKVGIGAKQIAF